ncbi:MAG: phage NTP-binding protein [Clostridia bacterium]|jgi:hypothetical protein|nr:phage NTP-binding protein [Clostridia bacterium]
MRQSAIGTFEKCPFNYDLEYNQELDTYPTGDAQNPLIIGTVLHYGCETGDVKQALELYFNQYRVITDLQINEAIKLENLVPKVLDLVDSFDYVDFKHEIKFNIDGFEGTADLIAYNADGSVDLYDFKYSNNVDYYLKSMQLHIYKYYLEKLGFEVRKMAFIFVPKTFIRQKKTESLEEFRLRLKSVLAELQPTIEYIEYDPQKVADAFRICIKIYNTTVFEKNPSKLCDWCKFKSYCQKGENYMVIPKNERRTIEIDRNPDMWVYGASYTGKTTFVDQLDDTLMLNTDGNTDAITSPVIRIKDEILKEGRKEPKRKYAWEVFKDVIAELETNPTDFKNVCVDLVEDMLEHCRLYMYDKNGWEHEQDGGYGKGYDMIRLEFLSTMKRLKNIGYRIILISKLATGEVTRGAAKYTTYRPNLKEAFAEVIAGIVDMTVLVEANGNDRKMKFKASPYIFGGSRFNFGVDEIPLDTRALAAAIEKADINVNYTPPTMTVQNTSSRPNVAPEDTKEPQEEQKATPKRRRAAEQ